jgi:hypothetical protein
MTARRAFVVAGLLLLLAGLIWLLRPGPGTAAPSGFADPKSQIPSSAPARASDPKSQEPRASPAESESDLARDLNRPAADISADLRIVDEILHAFQSNFAPAGNPTGTNAEITAALTGRNRLRLALIPAGHPAINAAGELCDRWGTPFFLHAESGTRMEIRSAGPDRKLWTGDDAVLSP